MVKEDRILNIVKCAGTHQTPVTADIIFFFGPGIVAVAVGQQPLLLVLGAHGEGDRTESARQFGIYNSVKTLTYARTAAVLVERLEGPPRSPHSE